MKLFYTFVDKVGLGYPYLIKGNQESLQPIINYLNTVEIFKEENDPFLLYYHNEDRGIYLCENEFEHLNQNSELLGVELEEEINCPV